MAVAVNGPGGGIMMIAGDDVLWMRQAFPSEWKGTNYLRLRGAYYYSVDRLDDLRAKLGTDGARLVEFHAPEARVVVVVNAENVSQVSAANPAEHPDKAKSVLQFGPSVALAVRESPEEAGEILSPDVS